MKKWWVIIFVISVAGGLFFWAKSPSKGSINNNVVTKEALPTAMEYIRYDNSIISFAYENKYDLNQREDGQSWQLVGKGGVPVTFVIIYKDDSGVSVDDVSGVKMRRIKTEEYTEGEIKDGLLFSKAEPYELSAFFLKNGKSLTVSMMANSNDTEKYKDEFMKFVGTINTK